MRCAINFIPPQDDPLTVTATRWIGRDPYTGERILEVETEGLTEADRAYVTAPARRYGFHGTLKAPFRLASSYSFSALEKAVAQFASRHSPVALGAMTIGPLDDFFALLPAEPSAALAVLAENIVKDLDRFRAPLDELDFAKRGRALLNERQLSNLLRWGYPYIFEDFRFHMTLTGPVPRAEREHIQKVLDHHFGPLAMAPMTVSQIAVYVEPEPYAPFIVHSVHRLASEAIVLKIA
jgi:putative phosphonate metabolism protein